MWPSAGDSDLLTVYNAYCSWRRTCNTSGASEQQFCRKNYLSQPNLMNVEELKAQLAIALADAGFLKLREDEGISLNKYVPYPHAEMRAIDPSQDTVLVFKEDIRRDSAAVQCQFYRSDDQYHYMLELLSESLEAGWQGLEKHCQQPVRQPSPYISQ